MYDVYPTQFGLVTLVYSVLSTFPLHWVLCYFVVFHFLSVSLATSHFLSLVALPPVPYLFHATELIHCSLVVLHAVLSQLQMGGVLMERERERDIDSVNKQNMFIPA